VEEPSAFGFLDPNLVIHGVQLIPAFRFGCTNILLEPSIAHPEADHDEDWDWYYVNMHVQVPVICTVNLRISRFVDRDMFMQFRGRGVGHKSTCTEMHCLFDDHDTLDKLPFKMEKEWSQSRSESSEEDDDMPADKDKDKDKDKDSNDNGEDDDDEGEHNSDNDSKEGNELKHEVSAATPFVAYVDDQVANEMDEYGYSGLDQVANENEENEEINDDEDMFRPKDREDMINELDKDNNNFAYL